MHAGQTHPSMHGSIHPSAHPSIHGSWCQQWKRTEACYTCASSCGAASWSAPLRPMHAHGLYQPIGVIMYQEQVGRCGWRMGQQMSTRSHLSLRAGLRVVVADDLSRRRPRSAELCSLCSEGGMRAGWRAAAKPPPAARRGAGWKEPLPPPPFSDTRVPAPCPATHACMPCMGSTHCLLSSLPADSLHVHGRALLQHMHSSLG